LQALNQGTGSVMVVAVIVTRLGSVASEAKSDSREWPNQNEGQRSGGSPRFSHRHSMRSALVFEVTECHNEQNLDARSAHECDCGK
jgi:hypothetical protein